MDSATVACETCAFFDDSDLAHYEGLCRRRSPLDGVWPEVLRADWCGEWRANRETEWGSLPPLTERALRKMLKDSGAKIEHKGEKVWPDQG